YFVACADVCCNQRLGTRTLWHGAYSLVKTTSIYQYALTFLSLTTKEEFDIHAAYPEVYPDDGREINKPSAEGTELILSTCSFCLDKLTPLDPETKTSPTTPLFYSQSRGERVG
ncbi:unnamed protein product, partial [Ectocarpus sp. 12 AP-2014]